MPVLRNLSELTATDFEAAIGTAFVVPGETSDTPIEILTLRRVERRKPSPPAFAEHYSLMLRGSRTDVSIDPQMVLLEHETLGVLHLFMSPFGLTPEGLVRYQIVFA
ncbi:hypothetical protein P7L68_24950 [Tistrella mobilis]|uniref:DUF6916 family protein n=1 Tax=Tistrella mobilis TaxID=171437 RepID=UPI003555DF33